DYYCMIDHGRDSHDVF
nr:immunoglobulin light chain junction region [Macaca mulatta]